MPLNVPPLPQPLPIGRGYGNELAYPCAFPGCTKKFKEKGDQEMHWIDHMIHSPRDTQILARKAYERSVEAQKIAALTPEFAPPQKQQNRWGRKVA